MSMDHTARDPSTLVLLGQEGQTDAEVRAVATIGPAVQAAYTFAKIEKSGDLIYARQANFANGPQQVNNAVPQPRTRENEIPPSKQSGDEQELLPDGKASAFASQVDPAMEAVGAINRTTNHRG